MNPRLQTLVIIGIILLAGFFLLGKLMMDPPKVAPQVCENITPTLGADVKSYIDMVAARSGGAGSANNEARSRLAKLEEMVANLRSTGVTAVALSQKISEFEKQVAANANLTAEHKSVFIAEFRRLRHTLIFQCAPKKATPSKPAKKS